MAGFSIALSEYMQDFVCAALDVEQDATPWLNDAISSIPGSRARPLTPEDRAPYEAARRNACRLGRDPLNPAVDFPADPGFLGGQCDTDYRIFVTVNSLFNGQPANEFVDQSLQSVLRGPIVAVFIRSDASMVVATNADGDEATLFSGTNSSVTYINLRDVRVERVDSQPDNCGDAPGAGDGPRYPIGGGDLIWDDDEGNQITEPVDVVARRPVIGPGGGFDLPFDVCFASFCLDVTFNVNVGEVNLNFGGGNGGDASPCCPPIDEVPEDGSENDPDEPDDDVRYRGIIAYCSFDANRISATQLGNGQGPSLFVPRIAVVRFAMELGDRRAWSIDIPIKQRQQVIEAPSLGLAYTWDIIPEGGVTVESVGIPIVS